MISFIDLVKYMSRVIDVIPKYCTHRIIGSCPVEYTVSNNIRKHGGTLYAWNGEINNGNRNRNTDHRRYKSSDLHTWDMSPNEYENYYRGYVCQVLWPVFHNQPEQMIYNREYFNTYKLYNLRIASQIVKSLGISDMVCIHDYHYISVGRNLKKYGIHNVCGIILYQPFPNEDSLMMLPEHDWLVRSLLYYDVIGFQTYVDAKNFISYILRFYQAELLSENVLKVKEHELTVGVFPCGICTDEIIKWKNKPHKQNGSLKKYNRQYIISSDFLNYFSDILYRFDAVRTFFEKNPQFVRKVSLLQLVTCGREDNYFQSMLLKLAESSCIKINRQYGCSSWYPINILTDKLISNDMLHLLYSRARVAIFTSLNDRTCLSAKEFILSQNDENPGVLILSGYTEQLTDAIITNPQDPYSIADSIKNALTMSLYERKCRHQKLFRKVMETDFFWWREEFKKSIKESQRNSVYFK